MNKLNYKKGFTLIELLVVVAIIGILSSVVLASLNSARAKGVDSSIKSNMRTIQTQSAIYYDANNSYLPTSGGSPFGPSNCQNQNLSSGTTMLNRDATISSAIERLKTLTTAGHYCANNATSFAVAMGLKTTNGTSSWCVDSSGNAKEIQAAPSGSIGGTQLTTFVCN